MPCLTRSTAGRVEAQRSAACSHGQYNMHTGWLLPVSTDSYADVDMC